MSYMLSHTGYRPTVFLARRSELGDRFDPEMVLFRRRTHEFKYPAKRLVELFSQPPQYGAGERGLEREDPTSPRYIRITDINEFGELLPDLGATASNIEARYVLSDGDLLIARSGNTVGKAYLHQASLQTYECFFAGYLIRFRFDYDVVLPAFVFAITQLPYYRDWVRAVQRAAGQPNINAQEYSNFRIPLPPKPIQQKIVDLLHAAYETKRQSDRQALTLLASIDDVLLEELGLVRKADPPNTIGYRIFRTAFHKLTGQRFDPLFHQGDIFYFVREAKYDLLRLGDLAAYFQTGFAAGRGDQSDEEGAIIQIRPTNISNDRELVFTRNVTIAAAKLKTRKIDVVKRGEVLFNNTNSQAQVGKTVYFDLNGDYFSSNHITRIAPRGAQLNAQYLCYVLNLYQRQKAFFKLCTNWNNQSGVGVDVLERIPIPVPSPQHQALIVAKLENIRDEARKLRLQAIECLQQAKAEIETIILGKEVVE